MAFSVRLTRRIEQQLVDYCAREKVTRSEAVERALGLLFERDVSGHTQDMLRLLKRMRDGREALARRGVTLSQLLAAGETVRDFTHRGHRAYTPAQETGAEGRLRGK